MTVTLGEHPRYLEELRIGGGYGSAPDGGADFDQAGNIAANGGLEVDGAAAFGGGATVAGDFAVTGVDTTWSVYLPAHLGMPDPALPCGPVNISNWRNYQVATASLAFDPNAPEAAYFQFRLPENYDGRPLKFTLEWSATAGTSGDVRWGVNPISFDDGDTLIKTDILTYVQDTFVATSVFHIATVNITLPSASNGRMVTLRVLRDSANAGDTFDSDAALIGIGIDY